MQLTFGYSDSEDRIWLSSSEGDKFWLTRRLVSRFLSPVASLMEQTVPGSEVPNALSPACRIGLEHGEAMADSPDGQPAVVRDTETRNTARSGTPTLVNSLSLSIDPQGCHLSLVAAGQETRMTLNRLDLHRLLGALALMVRNAEWVLSIPDWLATPDSEF